jgi:hypothetical protein
MQVHTLHMMCMSCLLNLLHALHLTVRLTQLMKHLGQQGREEKASGRQVTSQESMTRLWCVPRIIDVLVMV